MTPMSRFSLLLALIASLTLVTAGSPAVQARPAAGPVVASSTPQHAAGVVIDTGTEVRRVCVRFSEDSISGEELLKRAKVDAVFSYEAMGTAVCSLCGVGCPASNCFCESESSGRYWNYAHASGAGWQRSSIGANRRQLRDGDVDGWAWGQSGATPPSVPFDTICPPMAAPPPSPSPTPQASPPPSSPSPTPSPTPSRRPSGNGSGSGGASSGGPSPSGGTTDDEGRTTASTPAPAAEEVAQAEPTDEVTAEPTADPTAEPSEEPTAEATEPEPTAEATERTNDSVLSVGGDPAGGAGPLVSLGWFAVALATVGGAVLWRRRTPPATGAPPS
jgi:hypothetical protein